MPAQPTDDDDVFSLIIIGYGSLGAIAATAVAAGLGMWKLAVAWLIEHQVLVPAGDHPWIRIPAGSGAGLDHSRTLVALAAAMVLVAAAGDAVRRHRPRARELS